jgi:hypothetical protein
LIIVSNLPRPPSLANPDSSAALKNANDMLKDVVKAMDKNGDQVIQYEGMQPPTSPFHNLATPGWLTASSH